MSLAKGEKKPLGKTPHEALTFGRALIENPDNWSRAQWGEGGKHCMMAALSRSTAYNITVFDRAVGYLRDAVKETGYAGSLASFNDSHAHSAVIAAYDRAIELAAAEASAGAAP